MATKKTTAKAETVEVENTTDNIEVVDQAAEPEQQVVETSDTENVNPEIEVADQVATSDKPIIKEEAEALSDKIKEHLDNLPKDKYQIKAEYYSMYYPKCREFHITADMMVFLENDLSSAINHQNTLKEGEVHTIKIF